MVHQRSLRVKFLGRNRGLNHFLDLRLQIMALIDHVSDIRPAARFEGKELDLMENSKHLVGINRSKRQVVICIPAIVEMKTAQHLFREQPCDDLLDILSLIVMTSINQHFRFRPAARARRSDMPQSAMSV